MYRIIQWQVSSATFCDHADFVVSVATIGSFFDAFSTKFSDTFYPVFAVLYTFVRSFYSYENFSSFAPLHQLASEARS